MIEKVKKYNVPLWYLSALMFTGMLLGLHFIWKDAGNYSISFTQFGPMIATFLFLYITKDNNAFVRIKDGLRLRFINIKWYIVSLIFPLLMTGISAFILSVFFDSQYNAWDGNTALYLIGFIAMMLGSVGEEIGWRGYLLPLLCSVC